MGCGSGGFDSTPHFLPDALVPTMLSRYEVYSAKRGNYLAFLAQRWQNRAADQIRPRDWPSNGLARNFEVSARFEHPLLRHWLSEWQRFSNVNTVHVASFPVFPDPQWKAVMGRVHCDKVLLEEWKAGVQCGNYSFSRFE